MTYSIAFKAGLIKRMTGRGAVTAAALSEETGVSRATLSHRKRRASRLLSVADDEVPSKPSKRVQDWTPEEKLRAVTEASALAEADLGAYLRRRGLHSEQLETWRTDVLTALSGGAVQGRRATRDRRELRRLEREVRRKDRALAETTALLVLKKKFNALFEEEDDGTTERSDE